MDKYPNTLKAQKKGKEHHERARLTREWYRQALPFLPYSREDVKANKSLNYYYTKKAAAAYADARARLHILEEDQFYA